MNISLYLHLFFFFIVSDQPRTEVELKLFKVEEIMLYSPFQEWKLENPSWEKNPFDLEAKVVFIHAETGRKISTRMFYDEENTWKFRFTGTLLGKWTFYTTSKDEDLAGWSGEVLVKPNPDEEVHGFMKAIGNKWGWEGTDEAFIPQYVMGKLLPYYMLNDQSPDIEKIDREIQIFVDEHGFSGFHIPVYGEWFKGENPDRLVYEVLEQIVQRVHRKGGSCHLWMWGSDAHGKNGDGPLGKIGIPMNEMDKRNLLYFSARMGPLPGWSMGYGYDVENGWASVEQLDMWKELLEKNMGWDHFLGARVGYDEKGLWAQKPRPAAPPHDKYFRAPVGDQYCTWLNGDYTGYTSYRPLYSRYVRVLQHQAEKPSFEEDRFRLRNIAGWEYKDYNEELTRRGLWHSAMAGGVANIWGNLLPTADHGGSRTYEIKHQIKTYSLFFKNRFKKDMESSVYGDQLCLEVPGKTQILYYRENTDKVILKMDEVKQTLPVIAVDTKSDYKEIVIGDFKAGIHEWKTPYISDWAVAVGEF